MELEQLLDRPIAFHRCFVDLCGVNGAIFLSQCIYWSKRLSSGRGGWFYKTQEDWEDETGLTRREQENARKRLKHFGILEEVVKGIPAQLWFRVNFNALQASMAETAKQACTKPPYLDGGNRQTIYTENTTEITHSVSEPIVSKIDEPDWESITDEELRGYVKGVYKSSATAEIKRRRGLSSWERNSLSRKTYVKQPPKPKSLHPSIESISEEDMISLSKKFKVTLGEVEKKLADLKRHCASKSVVYGDYLAALETFVVNAISKNEIYPSKSMNEMLLEAGFEVNIGGVIVNNLEDYHRMGGI